MAKTLALPTRKPRSRALRRLISIALLLLSLGCAVLMKLSFVFFLVGMLPSLVAYIVDRDPNKYNFSVMAALNVTGVFPGTLSLYLGGGTFEMLKNRLGDASVWFMMYGMAGVGWFIMWISPWIAAFFLRIIYQGNILHLEGLQRKLEEEWGRDIMREK